MAIIAVLVAIAIPIFTSQLEKSRESTDLANVRAAYAEVQAAAITGDDNLKQADGSYQIVVSPLKQKTDGWSTTESNLSIGGIAPGSSSWTGRPVANGSCTITVNPTAQSVSIAWSGEAVSEDSDTPASPAGSMTSAQMSSAKGISWMESSNGTRINVMSQNVYIIYTTEYTNSHGNQLEGKTYSLGGKYYYYKDGKWYSATNEGDSWTLVP